MSQQQECIPVGCVAPASVAPSPACIPPAHMAPQHTNPLPCPPHHAPCHAQPAMHDPPGTHPNMHAPPPCMAPLHAIAVDRMTEVRFRKYYLAPNFVCGCLERSQIALCKGDKIIHLVSYQISEELLNEI